MNRSSLEREFVLTAAASSTRLIAVSPWLHQRINPEAICPLHASQKPGCFMGDGVPELRLSYVFVSVRQRYCFRGGFF